MTSGQHSTTAKAAGIGRWLPTRRAEQTVRWHDPALRCDQGRLRWRGRPFNGERELYHGDCLLKRARYRDGYLDGTVSSWYPSGKLHGRREYQFGHKTGTHATWWENGQPRYLYHFRNGEPEGEAREWYENGRPARICFYRDGREHGLQRYFRPDGSLRASHVASDGRRMCLVTASREAGSDMQMAPA